MRGYGSRLVPEGGSDRPHQPPPPTHPDVERDEARPFKTTFSNMFSDPEGYSSVTELVYRRKVLPEEGSQQVSLLQEWPPSQRPLEKIP